MAKNTYPKNHPKRALRAASLRRPNRAWRVVTPTLDFIVEARTRRAARARAKGLVGESFTVFPAELWTVDLAASTVTHASGAVVQFHQDAAGGWEGKLWSHTLPQFDAYIGAPPSSPEAAREYAGKVAHFMRLAGDEFARALRSAQMKVAGAAGGKAAADGMTPGQRVDRARKAIRARWKK